MNRPILKDRPVIKASAIMRALDTVIEREARVIRQGSGEGSRCVRVEFEFDSWAQAHNALMELRNIRTTLAMHGIVDSNG